MKKLKYIAVYLVPVLALISFQFQGFWAYTGILVLYALIPIAEQILPQDSYNFEQSERKLAEEDSFYDLILYLLVPIHLVVIAVFLITITKEGLNTSDYIAYILMMGTVLGVNGINGGHELGHKTEHPFKMFMAQILLSSSLQNHFMRYHNSGHHRDVATPLDFSSADRGANFYSFALRSQIGGYFKTWKLESERLKAQGKNSLANPMILCTIIPVGILLSLYIFLGPLACGTYFLASVYGISILESQNYFSHYGLRRKMDANGRYERVKPHHSWNSDHLIGRVLLFELTRHSDHHYQGAKNYQILESREGSPMLPFGYPAMLILSYFPFLFKPIMEKQLKKYGF